MLEVTTFVCFTDPDRLVKAHQPDRVGPLLSCTLSVIVGATICVSLLVLFWRKDIQLLYKDNLDTPRNSGKTVA